MKLIACILMTLSEIPLSLGHRNHGAGHSHHRVITHRHVREPKELHLAAVFPMQGRRIMRVRSLESDRPFGSPEKGEISHLERAHAITMQIRSRRNLVELENNHCGRCDIRPPEL